MGYTNLYVVAGYLLSPVLMNGLILLITQLYTLYMYAIFVVHSKADSLIYHTVP